MIELVKSDKLLNTSLIIFVHVKLRSEDMSYLDLIPGTVRDINILLVL